MPNKNTPAKKYTTSNPAAPALIRSDPPARGYAYKTLPPITQWLHELVHYENEWFKYPEKVSVGTSTRIKQGKILSMPAGKFEVVTRGDSSSSDSRVYLWARYIG